LLYFNQLALPGGFIIFLFMMLEVTVEISKLSELIEINKDLNRYYQTLIPNSTYLPQKIEFLNINYDSNINHICYDNSIL